MNVEQQLTQLNNSANELVESIENESWDEAIELGQLWDARIRGFIRSLSAEQFVSMESEIEKIATQNTSINKRLIKLRAKVLTKIQENNISQSAIKLYNSSV